MSRYFNRNDLFGKIDYEGGIYEMLFGYGLTIDDLPEDDKELREAFDRIAQMQEKFAAAVDAFMDLLPDTYEEEDY